MSTVRVVLRSEGKLFGYWVAVALAVWIQAAQAASLLISTDLKPPLVFVRENVSVQLRLKNPDGAEKRVKLEYRIFQNDHDRTSPIIERRKWKEILIEGNQTVVENFKFSPGKVKTSSLFVIKFYEDESIVELESLPVLVYPEHLLALQPPGGRSFWANQYW